MTRSLSFVLLAVSLAGVAVACGEARHEFDVSATDPPALTGTDAAPDVDAAGTNCLSETLGATPVPLAMLLVMDRSGSMSSPTGNTKWDQARNAMIGFADTPGASGTKLGLTVFPPDPGGGDQCVAGSYAPVVPIELLPGNGSAIKSALLARDTTGSTPMAGAMAGATLAMKDYLTVNPNEEGVLILVTDGDPGACTGDTISNVTSITQGAATGTPRIRTFVVGMEGATFTNLDMVAKAGDGAPSAFNASGTGDAGVSPQQQLLDALEKIRSGALGCEYVLPIPDPSKGVVDPGSVAINFTAGKNDTPATFQRVDGLGGCGATTGGFYYDDPAMPKRIILCPASCEAVRGGTAAAKLDVVLGCIHAVN